MVPMTKNGAVVYVPDFFVNSYLRDGFTALFDKAVNNSVCDENKNTLDNKEDEKEELICNICGKSYSRKSYLDKHIKEKHQQ